MFFNLEQALTPMQLVYEGDCKLSRGKNTTQTKKPLKPKDSKSCFKKRKTFEGREFFFFSKEKFEGRLQEGRGESPCWLLNSYEVL